MNINSIILLYALEEITHDELKTVLEEIGFSAVIVCILLTKADREKVKIMNRCPSGSLGDDRNPYRNQDDQMVGGA